MPSLSTARRVSSAKNNNAKTLGQIRKENSDTAMELLWDSDPQSKVCYIYDYFHDDFYVDNNENIRSLNERMTYSHTNKTQIDAKFIIKSYQSMDKDQVEYYIQFKPSQKMYFDEGDDLYYYETNYRNVYKENFPIGLFVDIPDSYGIYHKWLICREEKANQFPKFLILPCDYELCWIEVNGNERIKRCMWSVLRLQSSYTIGQYTDHYFTRPDNQDKVWLPLNKYTSRLWYTDDINNTMRIVVSAPTEHPIVWSITKIENAHPVGIQKITIYQTQWNDRRDYIEHDENENISCMWADYNISVVEPTEKPEIPSPLLPPEHSATISSSTPYIKVGGSYKTLTFKSESESINYENCTFVWACSIDGTSVDDKVIKINGKNPNQKKIKFPNDSSKLGKKLLIKCTMTNPDGTTEIGKTQLELSE